MIIRDEQLRVLSEYVERRFIADQCDLLRVGFPLFAAFDEKQFRQLVQNAIARAATYGITLTSDVGRYLHLCGVFSVIDFDENEATPWAKSILLDAALSPSEKLEELEAYVVTLETPTHT